MHWLPDGPAIAVSLILAVDSGGLVTPRQRKKWINRYVRRMERALAPYEHHDDAPKDVLKQVSRWYQEAHAPVRHRYRWRGEYPVIVRFPKKMDELARLALAHL